MFYLCPVSSLSPPPPASVHPVLNSHELDERSPKTKPPGPRCADARKMQYWINMKTKKITWTNPYANIQTGEDGEEVEEVPEDPLKTRWTEADDPKTGRVYYFHKGAPASCSLWTARWIRRE